MGIWEKLGLDMDRHRMVALVGAGGKTSTMYALARQAADSGRTVVVTTTTHIMPHPRPAPGGGADAGAPAGILWTGTGVVTLGTLCRGDKLSGAGEIWRSCNPWPMWYWWRPTGPSACP